MSNLFWKIFLWFWAAMLLLTAAVAWSTYQLRDIEGQSAMAQAYRLFQQNSHQAATILEDQGIQKLQQWLQDSRHRQSMKIYMLSLDGQQHFGVPLPSRLQRFIQPGSNNLRQPHWIIIRTVHSLNDQAYKIVTTFNRPHPLQLLFTPLRILTALFISGLVCFWLARHISLPITRLRIATQKLSSGDLDVRVGPELGNRHDELGKLANDFDRMAEQLQMLLTSQQQLLRDVSHELRSPLARLQVALALARQRSNGQVDHELNRIESEAERLNELIGQVLTLARMDAGNRKLNKTATNIPQLLINIVADAQFESQSQQRKILIDTHVECTLDVDEPLLHSAIENIIRNALKYTAANTTVELKLTLFPDTLRLTIRDHGPGVPAEQLDDLFKPFVRLSPARERNSGGYGLGLAIAERAIHLHGGQIQASNCSDGGLSIRIELPLEKTNG